MTDLFSRGLVAAAGLLGLAAGMPDHLGTIGTVIWLVSLALLAGATATHFAHQFQHRKEHTDG